MKLLYVEPAFGASGDMLLAALVNLGVSRAYLKEMLGRLSPVPFRMRTEEVVRCGIRATALSFPVRDDGRERTLPQIKTLLRGAGLPSGVVKNSIAVFQTLAEAEGMLHGKPAGKVHFHEIGGLDSIYDIAGYFLGIEYLGIDKVCFGRIPLGTGSFSCAHGTFPVPAFATLEMLKGVPVYGVDIEKENITPTAAAILAVHGQFSLFPPMLPEKVGYGAGSHEFGSYPNIVRLTAGSTEQGMMHQEVTVMEFQIDDMSPELTGNLMEVLFSAGALDCYFSPVFMKKNRPGIKVTVLFSSECLGAVSSAVFAESTTIGVRVRREERITLERKIETVMTSLGPVQAKTSIFKGRRQMKPEYEDLKKISVRTKLPLKDVFARIAEEFLHGNNRRKPVK